MRSRRCLALLVLPAVALMVSCGSDDGDDATTSTGASSTASTEPAGATPPSSAGPDRTFTTVPGQVTPVTPTIPVPPGVGTRPTGTPEEQAIADLAAREDIDPAAIATVLVEEVTWRNGSIGCPEPGMNYTQALVPGIRVVLELDGRRYDYHSGGAMPIFYCPNPESPAPG